MKQALHIFKKDFRYLWPEICLVVALAAVFAWVGTHLRNPSWVEMLLAIGATYLIARLVHGEAIPGNNQFWLTRPYRWKSLLGAKLLFILVFVNLPIFAARLIILMTQGFPLVSSLPGLLWSQLLIIVGASLPVAALATVTAVIVPFIFSALILLGIGFGIQEMMVPPALPAVRTLLGPVQWVWDSLAILALAIIAVTVLYIQYKNRRTLFSRTFGLAVAAVGAAAYLYVPWPFALAVQTQLSKRALDTSSIRIALDANSRRFFAMGKMPGVQLDLPIAVTGAPESVDIQADALAVTFRGADGRIWKSGPYNVPGLPRNGSRSDVAVFNAIIAIDPTFFNEEHEQRVTLRASIYLTLFDASRIKAIPLGRTPVNVMDGLQCFMGAFDHLYCRSAFRWPARLVYGKFSGTDIRSFTHSISYSPFPAGLDIDPIEIHDISVPTSARQVTIIVKEPLENVRCDFEIRDVHLADWVAAAN